MKHPVLLQAILVLFLSTSQIGSPYSGVHGCKNDPPPPPRYYYYHPPPPPPPPRYRVRVYQYRRPPPPPPPPPPPTPPPTLPPIPTTTTPIPTTLPPPPKPFYTNFRTVKLNERGGLCGPLVERSERYCEFNGTTLKNPKKCWDSHLGFNYKINVTLGRRKRCEENEFEEIVSHFKSSAEDCSIPIRFEYSDVVKEKYIMAAQRKEETTFNFVCTCKEGFRTSFNLKGCEHTPECHLPDNDCVTKSKKKVGVKSCIEDIAPKKYECECGDQFELSGTSRECKPKDLCKTNACGKDPRAQCNVLPTGGKSCTCDSKGSGTLHYLPAEQRCCEDFFASALRQGPIIRLMGELKNHSRTVFAPLTKVDFAVGHGYCNTFYVTSTGVLACLRLNRQSNDLMCYKYNDLYACRCLGDQTACSSQEFESARLNCPDLAIKDAKAFCAEPTVFRSAHKLNTKHPEVEEPQLDPKKDESNKWQIEAIFSPLAMDFYMSWESVIEVRHLKDDVHTSRALRRHLGDLKIPMVFNEVFIVSFQKMHERGASQSVQDSVSFYIILATTYDKTYIFGIYDDCATFNPKITETRRSARLFLWTRPSHSSNKGLQFGIEADEGGEKSGLLHKPKEIHKHMTIKEPQGAAHPGFVAFNLNHGIRRRRHKGLKCQEWLDRYRCKRPSCDIEWKTHVWCPKNFDNLQYEPSFYERIYIAGFSANIKCYSLKEEKKELGGYMPICCFRGSVFLKGYNDDALYHLDALKAPLNLVARCGHPLDMEQVQAFNDCCRGDRDAGKSQQCLEFSRRRPYTVDLVKIKVSVTYGDVQIDTLDGASYIFNGALEVLMAKGRSEGNGVGFAMTALLQPGRSAQKVTFTTALAMQCRSGSNQGSSDLVQFSLNENRTEIQVFVNGVLRPNLTVGTNQTVELNGATLRTSKSHLSVLLQCGLGVRVSRVTESLSLAINLTPGFEGRVTGLLGNNDGNPNNDLKSRDGTQMLPVNSSEAAIFPVASTWRVDCSDPDEALLHTGKPCGAFNDLAFRPAFFDLSRAQAAHPEGQTLCGDNVACWVDLAGTNSTVLAEQSKKDIEEVKQRRKKEENRLPEFNQSVVICSMTMNSDGYCSIAVSDPDPNDTVTLVLTGAPSWMRFEAAQRRLSWTAPPADVASQSIRLTATATDSLGGATERPVVLHLCACENEGFCPNPPTPQSNETFPVFLDLPCNCSKGWAGRHCEKDADGCLGNPCVTQCTDVPAAEEASNATVPSFRCAACAPGYEGDGQTCRDIDECLTKEVEFPVVCINRIGTFEIACAKGFRMVDSKCLDIDECSAGTAKCPRNAVCKNVAGNYSCECPSGTSLMGSACVDQDECSVDPHCCAYRSNSECQNTFGGFECACNPGFYESGVACVVADLCKPSSPCEQICYSSNGGFKCSCTNGFQLSENHLSCFPIKNCSDEQLANCIGGQCAIDESEAVRCSCGPGQVREMEGNTTRCLDQDECSNSSLNSCVGVAICKDKPNGYDCLCPKGYKMSGDGVSCLEVNECAQGTGPCDSRTSSCRNTPGSFECVCKEGFSKAANGSCVDLDECSAASTPCSDPGAVCRNLVGSFECPCGPGFKNNGSSCIDVGGDECESSNPSECDPENGGGHHCAISKHCALLVLTALFRYFAVS